MEIIIWNSANSMITRLFFLFYLFRKPSGRSEVLQLMKVMDNMLMDAGVDEKDIKLEGPSQVNNMRD